jgi:hypothetical protein
MFELGDWVIETNTHRSCDVIAVIPAGRSAITTLYIVQFSDGKYEIFDESSLIAYDKYYWDNLEESSND